jgi:hypothetical protein
MVQDMISDQATLESAAFTYDTPADFSQDFSLGGCHAAPRTGPLTWRHLFEGSGWMLLLYGALAMRLLLARR